MNSSNDSELNITNDLLRSFKEYSFSDLDDTGVCDIQKENQHPLKKAVNTVMEHKAKFQTTLKSVKHMSEILNNQPNAILKMPTNEKTLKKNTNMRFSRKFILFCDSCKLTLL